MKFYIKRLFTNAFNPLECESPKKDDSKNIEESESLKNRSFVRWCPKFFNQQSSTAAAGWKEMLLFHHKSSWGWG
jgi:hypothetical protein